MIAHTILHLTDPGLEVVKSQVADLIFQAVEVHFAVRNLTEAPGGGDGCVATSDLLYRYTPAMGAMYGVASVRAFCLPVSNSASVPDAEQQTFASFRGHNPMPDIT